uniref:Uncharacterized protein n=1 Tax=Arundo donax TaxID=35708 RepID=A0A0A8Z6C3_ARUDO
MADFSLFGGWKRSPSPCWAMSSLSLTRDVVMLGWNHSACGWCIIFRYLLVREINLL